jgi:hypothetical protein
VMEALVASSDYVVNLVINMVSSVTVPVALVARIGPVLFTNPPVMPKNVFRTDVIKVTLLD